MKTRASLFFWHGAGMIAEDSPDRRRRRSPTLTAVALAVSVCLALALAAPRAQAAPATRAAPVAQARLMGQAALIAAQHPRPVTLMVPRAACSSSNPCPTYTICLLNDPGKRAGPTRGSHQAAHLVPAHHRCCGRRHFTTPCPRTARTGSTEGKLRFA
jgi:hypothetical protein